MAAERKPKELAERMEQVRASQAEIYKLAHPKTRKWFVKRVAE